jgi:hypothetical protein
MGLFCFVLFVVLRAELRVSQMPGKCSTTELYTPPAPGWVLRFFPHPPVLWCELRASHLLGKHSTSYLKPSFKVLNKAPFLNPCKPLHPTPTPAWMPWSASWPPQVSQWEQESTLPCPTGICIGSQFSSPIGVNCFKVDFLGLETEPPLPKQKLFRCPPGFTSLLTISSQAGNKCAVFFIYL